MLGSKRGTLLPRSEADGHTRANGRERRTRRSGVAASHRGARQGACTNRAALSTGRGVPTGTRLSARFTGGSSTQEWVAVGGGTGLARAARGAAIARRSRLG